MLSIEQQDDEDLLLASGERQPQIVADRARRAQGVAGGDLLPECPAGQFERGSQLRELGAPKARHFLDARRACVEERGHRAEMRKELPRQVHRALSLHAGAQQDRKQLGVGERCRAQGEQALARSLLPRPIADRHGIRLESSFCGLTRRLEFR